LVNSLISVAVLYAAILPVTPISIFLLVNINKKRRFRTVVKSMISYLKE
jgi:hypothetical protein